MNQYTYYIVDADGDLLLTIKSQYTNKSYDAEAQATISPLLPIIAKTHGLDAVYYSA